MKKYLIEFFTIKKPERAYVKIISKDEENDGYKDEKRCAFYAKTEKIGAENRQKKQKH